MATRHPETRMKLGIIGAGQVTTGHHLPALRQLPQIETVALADVDAVRLQQTADSFGIPGRFTDPCDLLADPTLQAVAVCTPPSTHASLAVAALEAGKHVFIEKPLALKLRDCDELQARASLLPGQQTMVGFNLRQHRLLAAASEVIRADELGELQAIRVTMTNGYRSRPQPTVWRNQQSEGGSVLLDLGPHVFDLVRFMLADDFAQVYATARKDDGTERMVAVTGQSTNGVQLSILMGDHTANCLEMDVFGKEGRLHVSGYRFDGMEVWPASGYLGSARRRAQRVFKTLNDLASAWPTMWRGGDHADSYRLQWEYFASCVQNGQTPVPGLGEGREALRATLASLYSLRQRQPVSLAALADSSLDGALIEHAF